MRRETFDRLRGGGGIRGGRIQRIVHNRLRPTNDAFNWIVGIYMEYDK